MKSRRVRIGKRELTPLTALALAVAASVVFASVFVYYSLGIVLQPVAPPVVFVPGDNAGQQDLQGNTIEVNIGPNQTTALITLHPTYMFNYYKEILNISNVDAANTSYNVYLQVVNTNVTAANMTVTLLINDTYAIDISNPGTYDLSAQAGALAPGRTWSLSLLILIPEGTVGITNNTYAIEAYLVYTPSNEAPPTLP